MEYKRAYTREKLYALRHALTHLKDSGATEKLYELARNRKFLKAQQNAFSDEPTLWVDSLAFARDVALSDGDPDSISEFALRYSYGFDALRQTSPWDLWRENHYLATFRLLDKLEPVARMKWLILLLAHSCEGGAEKRGLCLDYLMQAKGNLPKLNEWGLEHALRALLFLNDQNLIDTCDCLIKDEDKVRVVKMLTQQRRFPAAIGIARQISGNDFLLVALNEIIAVVISIKWMDIEGLVEQLVVCCKGLQWKSSRDEVHARLIVLLAQGGVDICKAPSAGTLFQLLEEGDEMERMWNLLTLCEATENISERAVSDILTVVVNRARASSSKVLRCRIFFRIATKYLSYGLDSDGKTIGREGWGFLSALSAEEQISCLLFYAEALCAVKSNQRIWIAVDAFITELLIGEVWPKLNMIEGLKCNGIINKILNILIFSEASCDPSKLDLLKRIQVKIENCIEMQERLELRLKVAEAMAHLGCGESIVIYDSVLKIVNDEIERFGNLAYKRLFVINPFGVGPQSDLDVGALMDRCAWVLARTCKISAFFRDGKRIDQWMLDKLAVREVSFDRIIDAEHKRACELLYALVMRFANSEPIASNDFFNQVLVRIRRISNLESRCKLILELCRADRDITRVVFLVKEGLNSFVPSGVFLELLKEFNRVETVELEKHVIQYLSKVQEYQDLCKRDFIVNAVAIALINCEVRSGYDYLAAEMRVNNDNRHLDRCRNYAYLHLSFGVILQTEAYRAESWKALFGDKDCDADDRVDIYYRIIDELPEIEIECVEFLLGQLGTLYDWDKCSFLKKLVIKACVFDSITWSYFVGKASAEAGKLGRDCSQILALMARLSLARDRDLGVELLKRAIRCATEDDNGPHIYLLGGKIDDSYRGNSVKALLLELEQIDSEAISSICFDHLLPSVLSVNVSTYQACLLALLAKALANSSKREGVDLLHRAVHCFRGTPSEAEAMLDYHGRQLAIQYICKAEFSIGMNSAGEWFLRELSEAAGSVTELSLNRFDTFSAVICEEPYVNNVSLLEGATVVIKSLKKASPVSLAQLGFCFCRHDRVKAFQFFSDAIASASEENNLHMLKDIVSLIQLAECPDLKKLLPLVAEIANPIQDEQIGYEVRVALVKCLLYYRDEGGLLKALDCLHYGRNETVVDLMRFCAHEFREFVPWKILPAASVYLDATWLYIGSIARCYPERCGSIISGLDGVKPYYDEMVFEV